MIGYWFGLIMTHHLSASLKREKLWMEVFGSLYYIIFVLLGLIGNCIMFLCKGDGVVAYLRETVKVCWLKNATWERYLSLQNVCFLK